MQDFLVKVQARPVRDGLALHWCSQWWDHPEAVSRLEALWKAFEVRRDPGTGAATCFPCLSAEVTTVRRQGGLRSMSRYEASSAVGILDDRTNPVRTMSSVACQRDGTTVLPRAWDHLEVSVSMVGLPMGVN